MSFGCSKLVVIKFTNVNESNSLTTPWNCHVRKTKSWCHHFLLWSASQINLRWESSLKAISNVNLLSTTYYLTVFFYQVTYAFQSESTLYSCLNVKEILTRNRRDIWSLSDCSGTQTHKHLVCKRKLTHLAKLAWPNGRVFVYEISGCGFNSRCSQLQRFFKYYVTLRWWFHHCFKDYLKCDDSSRVTCWPRN